MYSFSSLHIKACARSVASWILIWLVVTCAHGQENLSPQNPDQSATQPDKSMVLRIAVEEVRIDAVVLDKKGHPVTDLTADDFEIYQDDVPQKVLSSIYINSQAGLSAKAAQPEKQKRSLKPIPMPALEKEDVHRVLMFVVDDLTMGLAGVHNSKLCLRKFVEKQMQPGDLVAILTTGYGNSALQMFLSDKSQILARINAISWGSIAPFMGIQPNRDLLQPVFENQIAALRYGSRALKDLPGRKSLMMLTAQPTLPKPLTGALPIDYYSRHIKAYNQLANEALRAEVVTHILDIKGLQAPAETAEFNFLSQSYSEPLNPLPPKTGGILLQNSNFFVDGIGEVNNLLKGYYLLTYVPPPTTFKENRNNVYHRIKIKVKRRGTAVYARDGFYGVIEREEERSLEQKPLLQAIFSPFQHKDLTVNMASGYMADSKEQYMLRSWIHLNARNISFLKQENDDYFIGLETICLTSDVNGYLQDSSQRSYTFRVRKENLSWIKEHGIRFSLILPVRKPGAYYMRAAVKDQESGKIGSAYQYVEIPDLKKNRLALSDIFVINGDADSAWILSEHTNPIAQTGIFPVLQRDETRNPALRSYFPGDHFQYMSVIYNAISKNKMAPELESYVVLYKDGNEVSKSAPQPLALNDSANYDRIPVMNEQLLGDNLKAGDYVLQLVVSDKRRTGKDGVAAQTINFSILSK